MSVFKKISVLNVLLFIIHFNVQAAGCINWAPGTFGPTTVGQPGGDDQISADSGIYWLKNSANNAQELDAPACQLKADPAAKKQCLKKLKATGYFDSSKPTIIFIHGWQPATVENKNRFDFCYNYNLKKGKPAKTINTLTEWAGWNVGVFYWNQYADELSPTDAEAKIYSVNGLRSMRWKYNWTNPYDNKLSSSYCSKKQAACVMQTNKQGEPLDIVQMAYQDYIAAMPSSTQYHSKQIRIAGQSLGTQIAIQLTGKLLLDSQAAPEPTRLALMDPYFTPDNKSTKLNHLPNSVADFNAEVVHNILQTHPDFPISVFRTSDLSQAPNANPGDELNAQVAYTQLFPNYMYSTNENDRQLNKHISSIYLYFYSNKFSANPYVAAGDNYITAQSSDSEIVNLMRHKRYQVASAKHDSFLDFWNSSFVDVKPK
jgi:hypothetical protein